MERNWTGILIEPVPSFYNSIISKNRNIYSINACIAKNKPIISKFTIGGVLSGRLNTMEEGHKQRLVDEMGVKVEKNLYIPCFSLNTILNAIGIKRVNYFSLDLEGGEYDVLTSIDFSNIKIDSFSIEHNGYNQTKLNMINYLVERNYSFIKEDNIDIYFLKVLNKTKF